VRALAALLAAVLVAVVAACGDGDEAPSAVDDPTTATTAPSDALGSAPAGLTGTELHVHGGLSGVLTDSAGNAIGVDGSQYFVQAGEYEGAWTAEEGGEVRFVVRNYADEEIAETAATFPFVVRPGDRITMSLRAPADLDSLALAVHGSDDRTMPFGEPVVGKGASDRLAPGSRIAIEHDVDAAGRPIARVTITATDAGGAGVGRIEYGLSPSGKPGVYRAPFEVPAVGRITVRTIDRAGNVQAPYARASLAP
jgi:hypothetical protein